MAQKISQSYHTNSSSSSHEMHVPIDINEWFNYMESNVERAHHKCIPRVATILRNRESNKKCFDPVVISLGPYHHGKPHLKRMEQYKWYALKHFVDNDLSNKGATFYKEVEEVALEAKKWYQKPLYFSDDLFKKMMYIDGCFILNFINESVTKQESGGQVRTGNAITSNNNSPPLLSSHDEVLVLRDMMMLENQVPFTVLQKLMSIKQGSDVTDLQYFTKFVDNVLGRSTDITTTNYSLRDSSSIEIQTEPIHLLDLFRTKLLCKEIEKLVPKPSDYDVLFISQSVTELKEAGIVCRKSEKRHLNKIDFKKGLLHRVLLLPPIVIDDLTKYLFPNMIAYEMSPGGPQDYGIISYICFMDALVDHEGDVKELKAQGIFDNALSTDKEVADFFNGLATDLVSDSDAYAAVKRAIANHYKSPFVKFRVSILDLCQTYCNSPWATIGFFAGVFLLFLAAVQTYFTVFPRRKIYVGSEILLSWG